MAATPHDATAHVNTRTDITMVGHDHDGTPEAKLLAANTHESPSADTHHAKAHPNTEHTDASPTFHRMRSGLYYSSGNFSNGLAPVLDELRLGHFAVAKTVTVDRIGVFCGAAVALSTSRLGIYRDNGDGYPGALVLDAGTVDTSSTGFKEITISQQLIPDLYWIGGVGQVIVTALLLSSLTASGGQFDAVGAVAGPTVNSPTTIAGFAQSGVSGTLPANFTTTKANGLPYRVWLRVA